MRILPLLVVPALFAGDLAWVNSLGGRVDRDAQGNAVAVHLGRTWVDDSELLDLAQLPRLVRLDLSHTRITDDGLLHLKSQSQIEDLNLFYAEQITDQGMNAIKGWKNLRRLNVRGTRISDGTLAIAGTLPGLESLDIAYTQITDNGLDALVPLTHLTRLSLGRSKLSDRALEVLRLLTTLEYLDLGGPHPGSGGKRETGGAPLPDAVPQAIATLKHLRGLKLSHSRIGAGGLRILAPLDHVEKLSLAGCELVNDAALQELAQWKGLKYLDVQATKVSPEGLAALQNTRPGLAILSGPPADTGNSDRVN
jgi:Leucine-rich repeat (LRR) protein